MDTVDHEVDLIVRPGATTELKDLALVPNCVRYGRFAQRFAQTVVSRGQQLCERLRDGIWWDRGWADWRPPASWVAPELLPSEWYR
jgi:hypothetical protein